MDLSTGMIALLAGAMSSGERLGDDGTRRQVTVVSDKTVSGRRIVLIKYTRLQRRIVYAIAPMPEEQLRVLGLENSIREILCQMLAGENLAQTLMYVVMPTNGGSVRIVATEGPTRNIMLSYESSQAEMMIAIDMILDHRESVALFK